MRHSQLFGLILGIALAVATSLGNAGAFDPPNVPLYPPDSYPSAVVNEIKATHRATYQVIDNYGWSGWRGIVEASLDTGSSYQNSLGNILTAAVPSFSIREANAGETPTILEIAESAAAQQTHCNDPAGWSVACAFLLNPTPAPTYFKAATMQLYPFVSQAAVVEHETNHHVSRACDQYLGGCPNKTTGAWQSGFQCTGNIDTLMDCSTSSQLSARFAQPYDVAGFLLATGFTAADPCAAGDKNGDGLRWSPCLVNSDGTKGRWLADSSWSVDPRNGHWYNPRGQEEWGDCDQLHRDCPDLRLGIWVFEANPPYDWGLGVFLRPPL